MDDASHEMCQGPWPLALTRSGVGDDRWLRHTLAIAATMMPWSLCILPPWNSCTLLPRRAAAAGTLVHLAGPGTPEDQRRHSMERGERPAGRHEDEGHGLEDPGRSARRTCLQSPHTDAADSAARNCWNAVVPVYVPAGGPPGREHQAIHMRAARCPCPRGRQLRWTEMATN